MHDQFEEQGTRGHVGMTRKAGPGREGSKKHEAPCSTVCSLVRSFVFKKVQMTTGLQGSCFLIRPWREITYDPNKLLQNN